MEDEKIVALYHQRSECAIEKTAEKYGKYCYAIAYRVLYAHDEAEESVNDTLLAAWNSMPPHKPRVLSTFLGKITRRISIDRWRKRTAERRGGGEVSILLSELGEIVSDGDVMNAYERRRLTEVLGSFVRDLPTRDRAIFLHRYFYLESVTYVAHRTGLSETAVKSVLFRLRGRLRERLEREELL